MVVNETRFLHRYDRCEKPLGPKQLITFRVFSVAVKSEECLFVEVAFGLRLSFDFDEIQLSNSCLELGYLKPMSFGITFSFPVLSPFCDQKVLSP